MASKICIVTDQHLSANPRVWKEALSLSKYGYDVSIVTKFNSHIHKKRDFELLERLPKDIKYIPAYSLIREDVGLTKILLLKGLPKFAIIAKRFGIETSYLISNSLRTTFKVARAQSADLYIAHVEGGFFVGKLLAKKGAKVAFDFEDWYSNDYLIDTRPIKLLKSLESFAMNNGVYTTAPSKAMASALSKEYNKSKTPTVIYNSFPRETDSTNKDENKKPCLVWFSQTVGSGRGLEKLIDSLKNVFRPLQIKLIGNCSGQYKSQLESLFPYSLGHSLEFIPPVKHHELHAILQNCDLGLAIEDDFPENKNTTVSNKILQYLQAGLKVLATSTEGQKEIQNVLGDAVMIVPAKNNATWAQKISDLLNMEVDKQDIVNKYCANLSWDIQEKKLIEAVEHALADK